MGIPGSNSELPSDRFQRLAGRELIEETGYRAEKITPLCEFYSSPGFCTERMYAFVAEGLVEVGQALEETEQIEGRPMPVATIREMIASGELVDGKSLVTLMRWMTPQG